jgi:hypothetical protein
MVEGKNGNEPLLQLGMDVIFVELCEALELLRQLFLHNLVVLLVLSVRHLAAGVLKNCFEILD